MTYGIHQTDDERSEFLERATSEQLEELASIAERYRLSDHHDLVADFFDKYPITKHADSAKLYWLFAIMHDAGLPLSPTDWNTVEKHIQSLGRFGSFRLASDRAFAARFLADFGDKARPAIPALHRALQDPDMRVQIWAHLALAVIEGHWSEHEKAVREIYRQHHSKDEFGEEVGDIGPAASAALEKFRELR
jgi:hypothetical protein